MSIEEKYDEIRALMAMGKEKGYLLYEEINELLPADVTSAEELDDLFSALGSAGIGKRVIATRSRPATMARGRRATST